MTWTENETKMFRKVIDNDVVGNFLSTLDLDLDKQIHIDNAARDRDLYDWTIHTWWSILMGIDEAYKGKRSSVVKSNSR